MIKTSIAQSIIHKTSAFQSIVDRKAAKGAGVVQGSTKYVLPIKPKYVAP